MTGSLKDAPVPALQYQKPAVTKAHDSLTLFMTIVRDNIDRAILQNHYSILVPLEIVFTEIECLCLPVTTSSYLNFKLCAFPAKEGSQQRWVFYLPNTNYS